MRQGKNKRSRGNKDPEGDMYMNVQAEEIPNDSYSRPHSSFHHHENYRTHSTAGRNMYVSARDIASTSRREDWRHSDLDHDRYPYVDPFSRGERGKYEDPPPRTSMGWVPMDAPPYDQPRGDWHPRYENGASTSAYPDPTWAIPNPSSYDTGRSTYQERWEQSQGREQLDDWGSEGARADHRSDRRHNDWRREGQREKNTSHRFQSDSGWDSRRRERSTWTNDPPLHQNDNVAENLQSTTIEDRSWEPAASWKSSAGHDQQHHRGHNGQRANQQRVKRPQNNNKARREWRADDGDLNNWTRRDAGRTVNKASQPQNQPKRKHPRSPSRSRSRTRSPTGSYKSPRSSRGRSQSRSISPAMKRRRRDSSPVTLRSQTPSERGVNRLQNQHERYPRTPSPHRRPAHYSPVSITGRRRSPSVVSTSGSERSRTKSPIGHGRSVHRLPPNHHPPPAFSPNTFVKASGNGSNSRRNEDSRNGKSRVPKHNRKSRETQNPPPINDREYDILQSNDRLSHPSPTPPPSHSASVTISMPPPASVPLPHVPRPRFTQEFTPAKTWASDARIDIPEKLNRNPPPRGAGFRPIGKSDSSLKKFFPGDDEDLDFAPEDHRPLNFPTPEVEVPTPTIYHHPQSNKYPEWDRTSGVEPWGYANSGAHPTAPFDHPPCSSGQDPLMITPIPPPPESGRSVNNYERPSPHSQVSTDAPQPTPQEMELSPTDNNEGSSSVGSSSNRDLYRILSQVGEGTFGKVYKARNTVSGTYVALKRIRMESERDGFPVTAMREIKLLQSLRHLNVVQLYEMMVSNGSVYMVFEYMDHDLTGVLSQNQFSFRDEHLKSLCHQMLAGLAYLHRKGVIHRDIKGSNILINNRGELKLADFGLARFYQKRRRADYTNRVITLWYRPPELLFGATVYGPEVDMWSAGCIMLELFTKKPVFQGTDEIHQVEVIFRLMGTPTAEGWTEVVNLPWYELVKPRQAIPSRFREAFQKWMSPAALDLAEQLLTYNPAQRITALQAMDAPYFISETPSPAPPVGLVDIKGEWHELETKRERAKRKEQRNAT